MKNFISLMLCCTLIAGCSNVSSPREKLDFNDGWAFFLETPELNWPAGETSGTPADPVFDDSSWRVLNLPHDWAVEGDFDRKNPSGTGGGALPGGVGWYRKTFVPSADESDRLWRIDFEGVYMNGEVFVNGTSLGVRPYGYISFGYDITHLLKWGEENVVAVRVDNSRQPNSRWYSGCGIYRNVWLTKTSHVRVAPDGVYVIPRLRYMPEPGQSVPGRLDAGFFFVQTDVLSDEGDQVKVTLRQIVRDACGNEAGRAEGVYSVAELGDVEQMVEIADPHLWDVDDPYLYTLVTEVVGTDGTLLDRVETRTGLRHFHFSAEDGFFLNNRSLKINGVCMHHDLGCLGSAFNENAARRQLEILRGMGCNSIRTSHNPPAPGLLDLCDEMGFIVQDEAFDMWRKRKTRYDYSRHFNEWHESDLRDFIRRDRNHPSILMWSIGNEVLEQWSDARADTLSLEEANLLLNFGHSPEMLAANGEEMSVNSLLTKKLADMVRELDATRPVTAGCNEPSPDNHLFRSGALDIIGFNYHNSDAHNVPRNFPGKPFIITESNSALMTRGYYRMPSDSVFIWPSHWSIRFSDPSFSCSSYENCHVPWGSTHEETLKLVRDNDYISGQYIWTGFDYIGEPTPYGWPARSSYFGVIDLAGFPKDVYNLYKSEWTDEDVLHLFPHWNWEDGQEIDMWCYYNNADEVELFVNGVSQGVRSKTDDCLHTVWRVNYEPGAVEVVARKDGKEVGRTVRRTAGEPAQIRLTMDQYGKTAKEDALGFVTVEVLDAEGNLCPWAENLVQFELDGDAAFIAGVDNGSPISMERFKDNKRKAFYGKCLVVLQAAKPGRTVLKATSEGLIPASVTFRTR
ncbi:MAG: DUF4982 domain-containing protein [Bacteroidales bacterium]|nr:DUF4982 domain-containing protein [Bacteroidales bacterium]